MQVRETTSLFFGAVLKQCLDEIMENQFGYEFGGCFGGIELGARGKQKLNELRDPMTDKSLHEGTVSGDLTRR